MKDSSKLKAIFFAATGCHENFMDSALVRARFGDMDGFRECESFEEADIIVIMGCSVHQFMEDQTRELIHYINEHKSRNAEVVVLGCISKVRPEFAPRDGIGRQISMSIDNILDFENRGDEIEINCPYDRKVLDSVEALSQRRKVFFREFYTREERSVLHTLTDPGFRLLFYLLKRYKDYLESRIDVFNDKTYCIKISTGCLGQCSYCSIKLSRGSVKSKSLDNILAEFQRGLDLGYKHFALLGTDIGDFGRDMGMDLCDLLEKMVSIDKDFKIRLRNVNPRWLIPNWLRFKPILETGKISYIQSPIQSGNNRILGLMKRGYNAEDFLACTREIRLRYPSVVLKTQIMVGFPTETETEFLESINIVNSAIFDYADVFRYTKRPRTPASLMEPEVPDDVIMRRHRKILFRSLFNQPWRKMQAIYHLNT